MGTDRTIAIRLRRLRPAPLTAGILCWIFFWAVMPSPEEPWVRAAAALGALVCFGAGAAAAGLFGSSFQVFGCCLHSLIALTAAAALNNAATAVGVYILLCQGALFGGALLLRCGLRMLRSDRRHHTGEHHAVRAG